MFPNDGCVPLNVFGQGSVSQAALDYITAGREEQVQHVHEQVAEVTGQGDVLQLPAGTKTVATGASWRQEAVHGRPKRFPRIAEWTHRATRRDFRLSRPAGAYVNNVALFEGTSFQIGVGRILGMETFGEAVAPLLAGLPFIDSLELNSAVRYAHYSGSGGIAAWKLGLDWQVDPSLRLRATRSRDVRAGSLSERYDTSSSGTTITDKLRDGNPAYAVTVALTGNPEVEPEQADTTTAGFVYRPQWVPGYSMSIDYYDIQIRDAIATLGAQRIIDECSNGEQSLCALIERNDDTGVITQVDNLVLNVAAARSRGIDLEMSWRSRLHLFGGEESLTLRGFFNRALESLTVSANGTRADRAGQTGLGGGAPRWQSNLSATYARDGFKATLQERLVSDGSYSATNKPGDIDDNNVSGAAYTNLRMSWQASRKTGVSVYFNVTNLFDKDPPRVPNWGFGGSMATNESLFDVLGRRFVLGMQLER